MYQQICTILRQNNIPFKDIAWTDENGTLQLNDNEYWVEYVIDNIDSGFSFFNGTKWVYYKVINQIGVLNQVFILEKVEEPKEEIINE